MRASQYLALLLIGLLVLLTPGGSACLPLPNGRHLHVAWNDMHGHDLPSPQVFTHATGEAITHHEHGTPTAHRTVAATSMALGPGSPISLPVAGEIVPPLPAHTFLAVPLVTVLWAIWQIMQDQPQRTPSPYLRPPRFA